MKHDLTATAASPPATPSRSRRRHALAATVIGLVGAATFLIGNEDSIEAPAASGRTETAESTDARTWALDAVPEEALAQRLAQEAAYRLAQPPAGHIAVHPKTVPSLPPRNAMAALPPPPQSFAAAPAPNRPPSQNPGGVDGNRPARPIPGFAR